MRAAFALFLIALIIRLAAIFFWQFDGLYGQDSYAYYRQAIAITENLPQGRPPPLDFFWPNGYPLLIALFMGLVGQTALAGQLAALLAGALLAPLAYLLTVELWRPEAANEAASKTLATRNHRAGLLAGLIVATAGQPILSSVVVMADTPALFWAALAAWLVVRASGQSAAHRAEPAENSGQGPALLFLAAGAALALAVISRWLYALITPALAAYALYRIYRQDRPWWPPLLAVPGGLLLLAPQLWLSLNKPEGLVHRWLLGWRPANFFQRQFETADGFASYRLPVGLFYAQPAGHPAYIFPLLGLAALWAIWRLWQSRQWGPAILLLGWIAPVYFFLAGIPFQNFRFGLTLYLPLVILSGFGLSDIWQRLERRTRPVENQPAPAGSSGRARPRPKPNRAGPNSARPLGPAPALPGSPFILKGVIVISLLGMLAWTYPMLDNFLTAQNRSKIIARQVEQALPARATLLTFGLTLTVQHYTQLKTLEIYYLDETSLDALTRSQTPLYLLLDPDNIQSQWQGKRPDLNYTWLQDNTKLTRIDTFRPYILFKVERPDDYGSNF